MKKVAAKVAKKVVAKPGKSKPASKPVKQAKSTKQTIQSKASKPSVSKEKSIQVKNKSNVKATSTKPVKPAPKPVSKLKEEKPKAQKPEPVKPIKEEKPAKVEKPKSSRASKTPEVPPPVYRPVQPGKPNLKKIVSNIGKLDPEVRQALKEFIEANDPVFISFPYQGKEMKGYIFAYKGIDHLIIVGIAGAPAIGDDDDEVDTMDIGEETPDVGDEDLGGDDDEEEEDTADEPYDEEEEEGDED
ncbi:MAG: hypothetical protein IPH66_13960 [Crocinitomicaceae bacterium]|nr:hypothetical protein [Crocinitomicaceae bacterium]